MRIFIVFIALVIGNVLVVSAEEPTDFSVDADVGIIDQMVSISSKPTDVYVVIGKDLGAVRRYPGSVVPAHEGEIGDSKFLVGARLPRGIVEILPDPVPFFFVMFDDQGKPSATPVRQLSKAALLQNSKIVQAVIDYVNKFREQVQEQTNVLERLERDIQPLREQASKIAGVDDIVDLKMEVARLRGYGQENIAEIDRLKALVDEGRRMPDPTNIDFLLEELSLHLREAAQVTAMADRLHSRRKQAAVSTLERKLAMIEETKSVDREALAREVLALRDRRKKLEHQLNTVPVDAKEQF